MMIPLKELLILWYLCTKDDDTANRAINPLVSSHIKDGDIAKRATNTLVSLHTKYDDTAKRATNPLMF